MTLQDVNNSKQDRAEAQESPRRREPADHRPKKSQEQARLLAAITELVQEARANGDSLTGPTGLLKDLTKMVLEVSLEEEMTEHLGHGKHESPAPATAGDDESATADERIRNVRNGTRTKTVLTDNVGKIEIQVPRDRSGTFEPVIVPKHHRKLGSVEQVVLSLTAKGLTTGEISAHLEEIYGASVSKDTISRISDRISDPDQRGDERMALKAAGGRLRGDLHRRDRGQGPRLSTATGRSRTGRSTPRSGSLSMGARTCSGCGPAPQATVRGRSTGWRC